MDTRERTILFAVDEDEALPEALPVVAAFARMWEAGVRVLHVAGRDAPNGSARRLVMAVTGRLREEGIAAEGEIRPQPAGEDVGEVVAEAAAHADLVVAGSHGRSGLRALFRGSVGESAARRLHAPTLVLHAPLAPAAAVPATVLVAVDGSPRSDEAAAEAAAVASGFGAAVFVLHVIQVVNVAAGAGPVESEEEAQAILRRGIAAVEDRGVRATGEVVADQSVASAIVAAARRLGAGLVVLGSRRPSALEGLVLGSVAHEVIHQLRRPVLLAGVAGTAAQRSAASSSSGPGFAPAVAVVTRQ